MASISTECGESSGEPGILLPRLNNREYSLPGSYRRIINKPEHVTWRHMHYTDPDLPLVQSDEDRILGVEPPAPDVPDGEFLVCCYLTSEASSRHSRLS